MGANLWLGDQKDRHLRFARRPLNLFPRAVRGFNECVPSCESPLSYHNTAKIGEARPLRKGERQSGYHCVSFANYSQFTDSVLLHMRVILHRRDTR